MKDNCLKTAILLFTRTPHNVSGNNNLLSNTKHQDENILVRILEQHLMGTAKATGLPVYEIGRSMPQEANFGEKLNYAFDKLFGMNYEQVLVIGNDHLHISTETLLSAQSLLSQKDVVIGPTFNGGGYLFGCSKFAYPQTDLLEIRWGTNHVFEDIVMTAAIDNLSIGFLPTEVVMQTPSDFQLCIQKYPPFESLSAQIEDSLNAFESSILQLGLPEIIDERIFYTPSNTVTLKGEKEVFQFCLN